FQFLFELWEVVDLAVEDDPDGAFRVGHRLMPAGQVDDRQTAEAEPERPIEVIPVVIGAAMHDAGRHPGRRFRKHRSVVAEIKLPANATHRMRSLSSVPSGRL